MTTATVDYSDISEEETDAVQEEARKAEEKKLQEEAERQEEQRRLQENLDLYNSGETISDTIINENMDQQLIRNIEQYVLQNMSRGQINLEGMSADMGMGRVPFYTKVI